MNAARNAATVAMAAQPDHRADKREQILLVVASIPAGRIATYGEVAAAAGLPGRARLVGRILSELPRGTRIPWHRVVAAAGRLAERGDEGARRQRDRLRKEGVTVKLRGQQLRADLLSHGWQAGA